MPTRKTKTTITTAKLPDRVKVQRSEIYPSKRGPKPTLSTDQIARAAIRVADTEGLASVSMKRIAKEVGVTTMALYRYFSSKAELVDHMLDFVGGPAPDLGRNSVGWRSKLREWTRRCSIIYRDHPWFLQATSGGRRIMGPNELEWLDAALGALGETGLSPWQQHQAFLVLIGHVRSNAQFMAAGTQRPSAEQWASAMTTLLKEHSERYLALKAVMKAGAFCKSQDDSLDFGMECILDGIESLAHA